jgi:hypothetical protein
MIYTTYINLETADYIEMDYILGKLIIEMEYQYIFESINHEHIYN